jgi:cytochrome oxidase Cu insertion factor (SCO1/SenC/PrrC family)
MFYSTSKFCRAAVFVFVAFLLSLSTFPASAQEGVEPLTFTNHKGEAVSENDFLGQFTLVYFGYTHCPDVCPPDLQLMSEVMDVLGDAGDVVQPLFITIDPQRDIPSLMADYVSNFHPRFIGLTGTTQEIARAARAYGAYAKVMEGKEGVSDYFLNHTARIYLIGTDGIGIELFSHDLEAGEIAAEILKSINNPPS